jgi:hypothetical protein
MLVVPDRRAPRNPSVAHFARLLILGLALLPASSDASSAGGRPLREHVRIAGYVFAGTVDSMRTVSLPTVVTLVHFSRLEVAKGDSLVDTLTLRMYGGIHGGRMFELLGAPRFKVGARYIVLTSKDLGVEPYYMPIDRSTFYPLRNDSVTSVPVVHDSEGHIVVLERRADRPIGYTNTIPPSKRVTDVRYRDEDTGKRMSEAEFLSAIRELVETERAE